MEDIVRIRHLPDDLGPLVRDSVAEGFGFLVRLRDDWERGANRFAQHGEALFEAREGGVLVGICGLNRDPYQSDPEVGRIRHLYVRTGARRRGTGRRLVQRALVQARGTFRVVRLRSTTEVGDRFYRALGFEATAGDPQVTHRLDLDGR